MSAFSPVDPQVNIPQLETEILDLWERLQAFERSVSQRPDSARYVFYDGPPFATGLPHYGHLVASTLKDIVPRYWTMRGRRVERRFGWDTHGLPIEMEMEKELGLSGPTSIKEHGVARFNEACRANVLRYTAEWRRTVTRLGRWVDFDNDYKTMDASFMESVWWVFKQLWDRDLVYEGYRVMPYSWRLSTSLSNFEANMDYRDVQDPAITVAMPIVGGDASFLVWTTTPWTLPSNLAIAVGEDIKYVKARRGDDDALYIVAEERLQSVLGSEAEVVETMDGRALVGLKYAPLFPYFSETPNAFQVIASSHVTTESGTGLVHMAPDFGEDDYHACQAVGIGVLQSVDSEGNFADAVADFRGRNVKEADPDIIRAIQNDGRLFHRATIQHSYPFCWRSGTPLIYRAMPARFVRVEQLRDKMVEHNKSIHWVPETVGQKRFGNWLKDARDWNVSRNRFWGTPIPVWRCTACANEVCLGSIAELEERVGVSIDDIHPHKIEGHSFDCDACSGDMKLLGDVFDCWFESGAMPYAQDHYPFENRDAFEANFPAEFIAEGLDQTRGWFYTLLVLSTALFDKPPFKNVIVNGMVLAEDGSKMSKSKKNYPPPDGVLDTYGADALRAYLINSPIVRADPLAFSEAGVRDVVRTVQIPLLNTWSFLVQYANIDGWHPATGLPETDTPPMAERPELDRWLLSVLQSLVSEVNTQMEGYHLYRVVPPILGFIDDLSRWYIRLCRRRFWRSVDDEAGRRDKAAAYATLYEALVTFAQVMAPILPFLSEALYQNLVVGPLGADADADSVHLSDYPAVQPDKIDQALEARVATSRAVVGLGRTLREQHRLRVRQPLARAIVVHHDPAVCADVKAQSARIMDELNVKEVVTQMDASSLATVSYKANFRALGPRMGKRMKEAATAIAALTTEAWQSLQNGGTVTICDEAISAEDVLVQREARGEVVIASEGELTVALDTDLSEALIKEGLAREVTSRLQRARKDSGLVVTDRITVTLTTPSSELMVAITELKDHIAGEVLAVSVSAESGEPTEGVVDIEGHPLGISIARAD